MRAALDKLSDAELRHEIRNAAYAQIIFPRIRDRVEVEDYYMELLAERSRREDKKMMEQVAGARR